MKRRLNIFLSLVLAISLSSCDDFLTYTPSDAVGADGALNTAQDATNALNGIYYTVGTYRFYGRNVVALGDIAADNCWMTGSSGHYGDIYKYTINPDNVDLLDMWEYGYKVIDRCTRIIDAAPGLLATATETDKATIQSALAQAYGVKALSHFTLVNIFGLPYSNTNKSTLGIIIVKDKPIVAFEEVSRGTVEETYAQVLADIESAKKYVSAVSFSAFHMNEAAVYALEARVKLYMQDWAGAITAAEKAKEISGGSIVTNPETYLKMWNDVAATSEDIFTVGKLSNDNLSANALNTLYGSYGGKAASGLVALFSKNDMRSGLFGDGTGEQTRALKFNGLPSSQATNNIPVFRLPEMYLIIAEAKAQLGQADAVDFVYEIAKRNPDLKKSDIPTGKDALLQFISVERRRELFQEGHRWFDLRRTSEIMTRVGGNYPINKWDASKFVYPIPTKEVNASGISQTENWNSALPK